MDTKGTAQKKLQLTLGSVLEFLKNEKIQREKEKSQLEYLLRALEEQKTKTLTSLYVYSGRVEELDQLITHLENQK